LVVTMTQRVQRTNPAATLAHTAALARQQVLLQRRQQEAVATARAAWTEGKLHCDRPLGARARLLVDLARSSGVTIPHAGTTQAFRLHRWRCC
jgi:hypothetical protein